MSACIKMETAVEKNNHSMVDVKECSLTVKTMNHQNPSVQDNTAAAPICEATRPIPATGAESKKVQVAGFLAIQYCPQAEVSILLPKAYAECVYLLFRRTGKWPPSDVVPGMMHVFIGGVLMEVVEDGNWDRAWDTFDVFSVTSRHPSFLILFLDESWSTPNHTLLARTHLSIFSPSEHAFVLPA